MAKALTAAELHQTGLALLLQWLEANGNQIEMAQPERGVLPHIITKNGSLLTFIVADFACYPAKGRVDEAARAALAAQAEKFGAFAAIAEVGLANAAGIAARDRELLGRAEAGASYVLDFAGLQYLRSDPAQQDGDGGKS